MDTNGALHEGWSFQLAFSIAISIQGVVLMWRVTIFGEPSFRFNTQ